MNIKIGKNAVFFRIVVSDIVPTTQIRWLVENIDYSVTVAQP